MNAVNIEGRIGTEIRYITTSTGRSKASFLLAIRRRTPRGSNVEPPPDWVPIEAWGIQADLLVQHNGKGSRIGISGRLRGRFWNPDGGERGGKMQLAVVAEEITFLSPPKETTPTASAESTTSGRRR